MPDNTKNDQKPVTNAANGTGSGITARQHNETPGRAPLKDPALEQLAIKAATTKDPDKLTDIATEAGLSLNALNSPAIRSRIQFIRDERFDALAPDKEYIRQLLSDLIDDSDTPAAVRRSAINDLAELAAVKASAKAPMIAIQFNMPEQHGEPINITAQRPGHTQRR